MGDEVATPEYLAEERLIQDERERAYFGISSTDVYNQYCERLQAVLLNCAVKAQKTVQSEGRDVSEEVFRDLHNLYVQKSHEPLQRLLVELRKIFHVPKEIFDQSQNATDSEAAEDATDEEIAALQREIEELQQIYCREKLFLQMLKTEKDKFDGLVPMMERVEAVLADVLGGECKDKVEKKMEKMGKVQRALEEEENKLLDSDQVSLLIRLRQSQRAHFNS